MSCYYCEICHELKNRDIHGCMEVTNEHGNVCDDRDMEQHENCIIEYADLWK